MSVTAIQFPEKFGNPPPVTDRRTAPDITCAACHQLIARDVTVVVVTHIERSQSQFMGHTFWSESRQGRIAVCEPCWDAAPAADDNPHDRYPLIRSDGDDWWDIGAQPGNWPCEWCGRPTLANVKRRMFPSCSKRCQVYLSNDRHHGYPKRNRVRESPTRNTYRCRVCQARFTAAKDADYCSSACRQKAYRQRRST